MLVMDKEIKVNIETGLNTDCEFTFLGTVASDKAYICGQRWMKWTLIFTCPRELGLNWQICQAFPSTNTTKLFPVTLTFLAHRKLKLFVGRALLASALAAGPSLINYSCRKEGSEGAPLSDSRSSEVQHRARVTASSQCALDTSLSFSELLPVSGTWHITSNTCELLLKTWVISYLKILYIA